jgi:isoquinoline 1-oxidoreductase beta subunit
MSTLIRNQESDVVQVSRRGFLGLSLGVFFLSSEEAQAAAFEPNAYVSVGTDGWVIVTVPRTEMGQGVRTSLAMLIAEEMDADWNKVKVVGADADARKYGDQTTGGSDSIRKGWDPMRKAGATAREMLVAAAAQQWGVPAGECRVRNGEVFHPTSRRAAKFGDLAEAAAKQAVPASPKLKAAADYRIIGTDVARLDLPAKVDGSAAFGIDQKIPGMKIAVLERCPVAGGKLKSFDDSKAKSMPGVAGVYQAGEAVAVVADSYWNAMQARKALSVQWDEGPNAALSSEGLKKTFREMIDTKASSTVIGTKVGSFAETLAKCATKVEAYYEAPFQAHSPMEPGNCTAEFRGDHCEVWAPTQVPNQAQQQVARAVGLPPDKVTVHTLLTGGGFGRRLLADTAVEAALVSKAAGKSIKVVWSREDELHHSHLRPLSVHKLTGGLDENGWPVAWQHIMACPSIFASLGFPVRNGADPQVQRQMINLYAIPHLEMGYLQAPNQIPVSWWRSVYHSQTNFAEESFLDELAAAAKKDPYDVRRKLLENTAKIKFNNVEFDPQRLAYVLDSVAKRSGWGKPLAKGRSRGIACCTAFGSYTAMVVEISMAAGKPAVHRVTGAMDVGLPIHPKNLVAQFESSVVFGLTSSLKSEITIEKGRVQQNNFNDYAMLRIGETPEMDIEIVKSGEPPTGAGEPAVPIVAPAVANAIFAATGKRLRSLPLRLA